MAGQDVMAYMDAKFREMNANLNRMNATFAEINAFLKTQRDHLRILKWMLGGVTALLVIIVPVFAVVVICVVSNTPVPRALLEPLGWMLRLVTAR